MHNSKIKYEHFSYPLNMTKKGLPAFAMPAIQSNRSTTYMQHAYWNEFIKQIAKNKLCAHFQNWKAQEKWPRDVWAEASLGGWLLQACDFWGGIPTGHTHQRFKTNGKC